MTGTSQLLRISVRGVVQGVGFRPFVYRLATRYHLKGWVCNTSGAVRIEVEGEKDTLGRFLDDLRAQAPPLARIEEVTSTYHPPVGYPCFEIRHSIAQEGEYQLVSPDIATCDPCQKEIFIPSDRRYRYPFTNCTNCGPRFTIIEDIPYDRPKTTMRSFQMCPECQREYDDPLNRRFHAQPNACPHCGPTVELTDSTGSPVPGGDALATASRLLREGNILAIKGLGGFLLACDATNDLALKVLRQRKRRPFKPLAIMVSTLEDVRRYCLVSKEEKDLLTSPQCPIVLLRKKADSPIPSLVAPNLDYLGVMLPYTPLHHILLRETGLPLVMTSGNLREEPIAKDNEEALARLRGLADFFLLHNRDICARYDDSVTMVEGGNPQLVRRARGYAPYPVRLPFKTKQVLACGAEVKNTFCLIKDEYAFLSQHIGDLENAETLEHFEDTIELYKRLFRIEPTVVAHDLHPDYLSTKYAQELASTSPNIRLVRVQHHHAHIVSCLAERGVQGPVLGVAFDGTGYGSDGCLWGGEFLVADYRGFHRLGHIEYIPLPGGAAAIERPYRMALSYLFRLLGEEALDWNLPLMELVDAREVEAVKKQLQRNFNSPLTSSCGRLFDGVSALLGIRGRVDYEGQAAIELEMVAQAGVETGYPFSIIERQGMSVVLLSGLFEAVTSDLKKRVPKPIISGKFHYTLAQMIGRMCQLLRAKTGIAQVALSGGVFQNRLLLRLAMAALAEASFTILIHREVPANDGGISLGQAVIANFA